MLISTIIGFSQNLVLAIKVTVKLAQIKVRLVFISFQKASFEFAQDFHILVSKFVNNFKAHGKAQQTCKQSHGSRVIGHALNAGVHNDIANKGLHNITNALLM